MNNFRKFSFLFRRTFTLVIVWHSDQLSQDKSTIYCRRIRNRQAVDMNLSSLWQVDSKWSTRMKSLQNNHQTVFLSKIGFPLTYVSSSQEKIPAWAVWSTLETLIELRSTSTMSNLGLDVECTYDGWTISLVVALYT